MSSKQEHPIQAMGFWMFGLLSVVLPVLKLTVAGYWSWWRVMLPFLAFLGHNAVYLLAGFLCFCWLKHEEDEEEPTTVQKHSREGYNLAKQIDEAASKLKLEGARLPEAALKMTGR
jgi:hypothetical protein